MLKRKIINNLLKWKENHKNNCLLLIGARQVGKTFILKEFSNHYYEKTLYINFIEKNEYKEIFDGNLDVETIFKQISLRIGEFEIIPGKTLIILDEIQVCENAITALKFLAMDNRFDCIASGSLLGIAYERVSSFPVGYVERLYMYSLDFEEFCWANGMNIETINYIKDYFIKKTTVPNGVHNRLLELFKEYIVIGGMPKVVDDYVTNKNFENVFKLQKNIIDDYKDDIIKYATEDEKSKIRACFNSIPIQLAKENKKFQYNIVEKNSNSKKYLGALEWLYDAGIINFCYNLSNIDLPLEGNKKEDCFKVYMKDTGLLVSMLGKDAAIEIIDGNLGIYKGAVYENIIADIFTKLDKKLYYFEYNSTLEIDFIIKYENKITAVEVKSGDNTKSKSLNSVINNWGVPMGIKLSTKNTGINIENNILCIPLYMAMFL